MLHELGGLGSPGGRNRAKEFTDSSSTSTSTSSSSSSSHFSSHSRSASEAGRVESRGEGEEGSISAPVSTVAVQLALEPLVPLERVSSYNCADWIPKKYQVCVSMLPAHVSVIKSAATKSRFAYRNSDKYPDLGSCREGSLSHFQGGKGQYVLTVSHV